MAIRGPEYKCLHADAASNGRVNDSGTWNKISLLQGIQDELVKLTNGEKFSNGEITPYAFLGDDAFAQKSFMMKPFPEQGNHFLSENLCGVFANRWRTFFTTI